ncbi:MAG: hypothetical protein IT196_13390 [Acidimicrobiales bacterium]|nr:hypothetical protein [Acidimicrobiales bacterium]
MAANDAPSAHAPRSHVDRRRTRTVNALRRRTPIPLLALLAGSALALAACGGAAGESAGSGSSAATGGPAATGGSATSATQPSSASTASGDTAVPPATAPAGAAAATLTGDNPLPALDVTDVSPGAPVALAELLPADRPLLVWMWAPS